MALPLLAVAVAAAIAPPVANAASAPPSAPLVEAAVARTLNATAEALAARRNPSRAKFGRPLRVRVVDRAGLRVAVSASLLARPPSDADAEVKTALLARLGLGDADGEPPVPPPEVSGFYDLSARTVLVGDWVELEAARFPLARDAALAVLDRRFGLARWLTEGQPRGRLNSDVALARQALAEGDATAQALEHVDPQGALPAPRALGVIADGIRTTLTAPAPGAAPLPPSLAQGQRLFATLDGLNFVAALRARLTWAAIDKVWQAPPRSSEQILHPDRYERGDAPDDVGARVPARLRGGWKIAHADTLGELGTRVFLDRAVDGYRAERAAAGWGGDRVLWLRPPARKGSTATGGFAAWLTTWDDESDAEDFAAEGALALAALARATPAEARPLSGKFRITDGAGALYALERRHRAVVLLFGAPSGTDGLLGDLTAAAAKGGRRAPPPRRR